MDRRGHVRVFGFDESKGNWEQLYFDINGESPNDFSGESIAINQDGSKLIVGDIGSDGVDGNREGAGHARVFEVSERGWKQVGRDLDGYEAIGEFGSSVQINGVGDRVIVVAPMVGGGGADDGAVYVYDLIEFPVTESPDDTSTSGSVSSRVWGCIGTIATLFWLC